MYHWSPESLGSNGRNAPLQPFRGTGENSPFRGTGGNAFDFGGTGQNVPLGRTGQNVPLGRTGQNVFHQWCILSFRVVHSDQCPPSGTF